MVTDRWKLLYGQQKLLIGAPMLVYSSNRTLSHASFPLAGDNCIFAVYSKTGTLAIARKADSDNFCSTNLSLSLFQPVIFVKSPSQKCKLKTLIDY